MDFVFVHKNSRVEELGTAMIRGAFEYQEQKCSSVSHAYVPRSLRIKDKITAEASNRLGLVKTKTPEQTEFALRKTLPKKHWLIYNDLLVTYGQNLCVPISPWCSKCKIFKYCKRVGVKKFR